MRAYLTLVWRELGGYFLSMTGYVIIAAAMFLLGFSFYVLLANLQQEPTTVPVTELFYMTPFFWFILLLPPPLITMRLFALEKFSGTFEALMTTPVSDLQVVLGKFSAAMLFYLVMWLPLLACLFIVSHYTSDSSSLELGNVASTFLGILLLGGLFISLGACASALTRSQVTAAMIALVFGVSIFLISILAKNVPLQTTWQAQLLGALSFIDQMHDFARGIVDTRPVLLCVTVTGLFLYLTLRVIESRRWK